MYQDLPYLSVDGALISSWEGWEAIHRELSGAIAKENKDKVVVVVECYHGTLDEINYSELKRLLAPNASCKTSHIFLESEAIVELVRKRMGSHQEQRQWTGLSIADYFDPQKLEAIRESISIIEEGVVLVYGIGASLVCPADLFIYADMAQWEAQQRLRRGDTGNIGMNNAAAGFEEKHKVAFFNDWPACNQLKKEIICNCHYYLETNNWARPKLATGQTIRHGLALATARPLKLAPFFDPDLWERQQRSNGLSHPAALLEWDFNCIPEENNLLLRIANMLLEVPLLNLIYFMPDDFLGEEVHHAYGPNLPVRFHFMDMEGYQASEFQVNLATRGAPSGPGKEPAPATGCYMLESDTGGRLELATPEAAQERYSLREVGLSPHDFVQIPLGIPFRLGANITALQIDAAPNVYSAKVPIDYQPAAGSSTILDIDLYHNPNNGKYLWYEEVLSNNVIKLTRNWFPDTIKHHTKGVVNILILVAGEEAVVESPNGNFEPMLVRYGETFIIPAKVGAYQIRPLGSSASPFATLKAVVRNNVPPPPN